VTATPGTGVGNYGAEIVQAPYDEPWGRTYTARDLGGHPWFFTTPPAAP
jgi:uncharacterized glyoxalase superfamily protein PhnB